jgi:2-dehydro-3-deoxygluconokinase
MNARLLAIGECMVEMAPLSSGAFDMGFAGDTLNTAWYARQIAGPDIDVSYLTAVGDDEVSARMTDFIQKAGITTEFKIRPGKSVGLYVIALKDGERSFSYWRDTSAAKTLADDLVELPSLNAGDIAFFSGISLAILSDKGRQRLLDVLKEARARGVIVAFDPNLRPRLWQSNDEMMHWIMQAARVSDLALPSYEDEHTFFEDAGTQGTANRYLDAGADLVVVKDGPNPVLVATKQTFEEVSPPEVTEVVDTTAAGDSFNAGVLVGKLAGLTAREATQNGCDLAHRVIGKRGALVDL